MSHPYLAQVSSTSEKNLERANERAARSSGLPGYGHLDRARQDAIRGQQKQRPLRRSEFINLNGYQAWLDYTEANNLPENHKWADADMHKISSIGGN